MGKSEVQSMPIHRTDSNLILVPTTCKGLYLTTPASAPITPPTTPVTPPPVKAEISPRAEVTPEAEVRTEVAVVAEGEVAAEAEVPSEVSGSCAQDEVDSEAEEDRSEFELPEGMEVLSNQVAGHVIENGSKSVGMLRQNGTVLKPVLKKEYREREVALYKMLQDTVDTSLIEMKQFVPDFSGVKKVPINGKDYECLVLEDLTKDFKEPCIMDIKIGRRTWDPNASYDKIIGEEKKYHDCKRDLAFCIPGFQVYRIYDNKLVKYGKEFGKSLNKDTAEDAIKMFLNADGTGFCRKLIVQFLAALWRIQHWARRQRRLRLYCSSILLVYDARRLRELVGQPAKLQPQKFVRNRSLYRPLSLATLHNTSERLPTGFSGQLTNQGPILRSPASPKLVNLEIPTFVNYNNSWQKSIHALKRTHSFQNDYDKDVQNKKQTYTYLLDDLCWEQKSEVWASAKMIDFAHVYSADSCDIDKNYLEGIENLVKLFEDFLVDSE